MTIYYGILDDGSTIDGTSLTHIAAVPYLKYLFKIEISNVLRFTPLAIDGTIGVIEADNFELLHISEDIHTNLGFKGRLVTVRDKRTGANYQRV